MARKITFDTGFQTVSAAQDLFEIPIPATAAAVIHSIQIDQSSDASSTEAERLQVVLKKASGTFTSGSGGSTVTATNHATGDAAGGITAERNNTTQASAGTGTLTTLENWVYDVLAGFEWTPIPEIRKEFAPSESLVLSLSAPADALTLHAKIVIELVG